MNTDELHFWSDVIKNYINTLEEDEKQSSYVDELISIFLSEKLLTAKIKNSDEKAEFIKLQSKVSKTKVTAAQRPKFESFYETLRAREQIEDFSKDIKFMNDKNNFYNIWICRSVELSEGVVPGTHIAKLSHSSCAGTSILDRSNIRSNGQVTTSSLTREIVDGTYPDAKLSKQVKFLCLEHNGSRLFDEILNGNYAVFSGLEDSEEELNRWGRTFTGYLSQQPKADALLKQIYFPIRDNYHLLCLLPSSSIVQKIYDSHFSKDARKLTERIDKAKRAEQYTTGVAMRLSSVARVLVTQSQPQNVSVLNGKRGGAIRLLSSHPPLWKSQLQPPVSSRSWFDRGVPLRPIEADLKHLRSFFARFEKLALSTREPKKQAWLKTCGNRILSTVLFYAESIQNLPPGWSSTPGIKLKPAHQYFLDPYRADSTFQNGKQAADWQNIVATDFARWLNKKIQGKDKKFTPQAEHTKLWIALMAPYLREQNTMVKAVLAHTKEELV